MSFFPGRNQSLPLSQPEALMIDHKPQGLRRRLSSLSLQIQPSSSPTYEWALHRSKYLSSIGESTANSIKKWWELSWGWILSRKPGFALDLELNDDEKGSWKHVIYKISYEFRKIMGSDNQVLPVTFSYISKDYANNLDNSILRRSTTLH